MAAKQHPIRPAAFAAGLLAMLTIAGCTSTTAGTAVTSPAPDIASGRPANKPVPVDIDQYIQAAETANVQTATTLVRMGARPTVADNGQGPQTMVIKDQDNKAWLPGHYRLVVYCIGTGQLYAVLQIGAMSQSGNLACAPTPQLVTVDIDNPAAATGMTVHIVPVGDTVAGVAYQVQGDRK